MTMYWNKLLWYILGNLVGNISVIYRKIHIQLKIKFLSSLDIDEVI